jgi:hypothetical protein
MSVSHRWWACSVIIRGARVIIHNTPCIIPTHTRFCFLVGLSLWEIVNDAKLMVIRLPAGYALSLILILINRLHAGNSPGYLYSAPPISSISLEPHLLIYINLHFFLDRSARCVYNSTEYGWVSLYYPTFEPYCIVHIYLPPSLGL